MGGVASDEGKNAKRQYYNCYVRKKKRGGGTGGQVMDFACNYDCTNVPTRCGRRKEVGDGWEGRGAAGGVDRERGKGWGGGGGGREEGVRGGGKVGGVEGGGGNGEKAGGGRDEERVRRESETLLFSSTFKGRGQG